MRAKFVTPLYMFSAVKTSFFIFYVGSLVSQTILIKNIFAVIAYRKRLSLFYAKYRYKKNALTAKENGKWVDYSTDDYLNYSNWVSYGLLEMGLESGEKIATVSNNRPEWNFTDMGMLQIGLVHVPIYPTISEEEYEQEIKSWAPATIKSQWSPRIGFSFPITKNDYFFINYGFFFQVPMFDYMFTGLNVDLKKGVKALYGNPDLKPEKTRAIELSYKRTFMENWMLSLTYFNKDISGLIDTKTFLASDSKAEDDGFSQYVNLAGGSSNGFEIVVEKKYNRYFSGKISYTYMNAKGLSGSTDQGLNYFVWGFNVPNEEFYL